MAPIGGADPADLSGQPCRVDLERLSQHAGAGVARLSGEHHRHVRRRLRQRHDVAGTFDVTGGVRYDRQTLVARRRRRCRRSPASRRCCRRSPLRRSTNVFVWNSITPRVGLTYALDEARRTWSAAATRCSRRSCPRAGGVRLADPIRLRHLQRGGQERGRHRAAQRDPAQPGLQGYTGFDPKSPRPAINRSRPAASRR